MLGRCVRTGHVRGEGVAVLHDGYQAADGTGYYTAVVIVSAMSVDNFAVCRRAYSPISTEEETSQHHLARTARMQSPQDRYRQKHYIDVYNDAGYRTPEEPLVSIEAVSVGLGKPAFAHRGALKDG